MKKKLKFAQIDNGRVKVKFKSLLNLKSKKWD